MSGRTIRPVPLAIAIALHLALIALLLLIPGPPRVPPKATAIALFDVPPTPEPPAPEPARAQPEPTPPTPPAPILVPPPELQTPSAAVVALLEQADRQAMAGTCDLSAPVQAALQASDAVRTGLRRIARDGRSVANAIMLWNADWIADDAKLDRAALAAIRSVIAGTIAAASRDCRVQPQRGPRLLILSDARENIVLALGSGAWRWQDLLDTARAQTGGADEVLSGNETISFFSMSEPTHPLT